MKLLEFPSKDIGNIPQTLRNLAKNIERGDFGVVTNLAWVIDAIDKPVQVGLMGSSDSPDAIAVLMFEEAKYSLIKRRGG